MNKQEFIVAVAEKTGFNLVDATRAVNAVLQVVEDRLVAGDKVILTGFGQFETRTREGHAGINPITKEPMQIPACVVPGFKAGKGLKEALKRASK